MESRLDIRLRVWLMGFFNSAHDPASHLWRHNYIGWRQECQAEMIIHAGDTNIKPNPNFVIFISRDEILLWWYTKPKPGQDKDMYKCKLTMDLTYNLNSKFDFILYLFYWLLKSVGVFAWDTNSFQFLVVDFNQAYVRMCQVKRRHFFYSRISLYFLLTLDFCTKIKIKI